MSHGSDRLKAANVANVGKDVNRPNDKIVTLLSHGRETEMNTEVTGTS